MIARGLARSQLSEGESTTRAPFRAVFVLGWTQTRNGFLNSIRGKKTARIQTARLNERFANSASDLFSRTCGTTCRTRKKDCPAVALAAEGLGVPGGQGVFDETGHERSKSE